ncbi:MAG: hypothetical protein V4598_07280 [Bdellovibrionota bacterium]
MKLVILVLALMSFSVQARVFECRYGDEVDTMVLEDHSVKILDLTLINMMDVNFEYQYRGYSFINDPWYDFTIDSQMLKGNAGYAQLRAHELQYGETVLSKFYECTPKN